MVAKRWRLPGDEVDGEALSRGLPCTPLLARLLARRGVREVEAAREFLNPRLHDLHDPFLLPGMEAAVSRIEHAVRAREPIAIFGDYDVDGISSTCLLHDFFRFIGYPVAYRLPHRLLEGYGIRPEAIRELAAQGRKLIITVDNGTSARDEADVARMLGVDLIITDHHQPPRELPRACAVVNPWVEGSVYPFKDLAGVGVTFKLVWALCQRFSKQRKLSPEFRDFLQESLSLVALGTISDVVPLLGENRVLAKFGLIALSRTRRPGLRKLVDSALESAKQKQLDASHVGFRLGPRLNAAGRLGHAETAMSLLLSLEDGEATDLARVLESENDRRREIEREMFDAARALVLSGVDLEHDRAIVLGREGWHAGVIGIVAARIAEEFARPTLLLSLDGERARGSARSVEGVHICEALAACRRHLIGFGGHEMAAGVEMEPGLLGELRAALNDAIPLQPCQMARETRPDMVVKLRDLSAEALGEIERLKPFGRGNEEPLLAILDAAVVGSPRILGQDGRHLAFHARQDDAVVRVVAFDLAEFHGEVARPGARVSFLGVPRLSTWQGRTEVELLARDVRAGA